MKNRVGRMLRDKRRELGLTQEKIANELGMSIHQYQRYEYGEHRLAGCPMRVGLKICELLDIDPYEAVFGDEDNEK